MDVIGKIFGTCQYTTLTGERHLQQDSISGNSLLDVLVRLYVGVHVLLVWCARDEVKVESRSTEVIKSQNGLVKPFQW